MDIVAASYEGVLKRPSQRILQAIHVMRVVLGLRHMSWVAYNPNIRLPPGTRNTSVIHVNDDATHLMITSVSDYPPTKHQSLIDRYLRSRNGSRDDDIDHLVGKALGYLYPDPDIDSDSGLNFTLQFVWNLRVHGYAYRIVDDFSQWVDSTDANLLSKMTGLKRRTEAVLGSVIPSIFVEVHLIAK